MPIELDKRSIDRSASAPPFQQLADLIRAAIVDGRLQPGEALPGEGPLGETVGIDRLTARAAITELVNEGLLIRRHGAVTRVADGPEMPVRASLPINEWRDAHEVARRRGESLPEVIRGALRRYIKRYRQ
jgi:GntR family transcriptional regulator